MAIVPSAARRFGAVRDASFRTPLVDAGRLASHCRHDRFRNAWSGRRLHLLGQQTPSFYEAGHRERPRLRREPVAAVLRQAHDLRCRSECVLRVPWASRRRVRRKSPAGQLFYKHFGEQIFRNDLCNADVDLGDLLIHVGAAVDAQRHAAQVFGADRTYFVPNGMSTSNKIVTQATLRRGDLVLFDRNGNHKSLHQGASRSRRSDPDLPADSAQPLGMIGAVDWDAWDESCCASRSAATARVADKELYKAPRPFRLARIQS